MLHWLGIKLPSTWCNGNGNNDGKDNVSVFKAVAPCVALDFALFDFLYSFDVCILKFDQILRVRMYYVWIIEDDQRNKRRIGEIM